MQQGLSYFSQFVSLFSDFFGDFWNEIIGCWWLFLLVLFPVVYLIFELVIYFLFNLSVRSGNSGIFRFSEWWSEKIKEKRSERYSKYLFENDNFLYSVSIDGKKYYNPKFKKFSYVKKSFLNSNHSDLNIKKEDNN